MNKTEINQPVSPLQRIASVDFFRGFTMFLLIGEGTRIYNTLRTADSGVLQFIGTQFSHHKWHGLHFWDLIQPFFMFIVGVAIPFAVANRLRKGDSPKSITMHAIKRSLLLLLIGTWLSWRGPEHIVFRFQNVLAQLSVTYLIAYLIMKKSYTWQLLFSVIILVVVDIAYRIFPVEGFNHPWIAFENLGAWVNNKIEGVDKASIWASLNALPTTAHTVWGVLCGKLLMSEKPVKDKLKILLIAGVIGLVVGYSLNWLNITPIIKKIATMSFVFASGGWAILALCFSYWLIDVKKKFLGGSKFFIYVGANCIFIYLFCQLGGDEILIKTFNPIFKTFFSWGGEKLVTILNGTAMWMTCWYICYWMYKNKIFIKI
jgi:predicted acyltransferase